MICQKSIQRPMWARNRELPTDVAVCPRCLTGAIYIVETDADTLTELSGRWVCVECMAGGAIGVTITVADARPMRERVAA